MPSTKVKWPEGLPLIQVPFEVETPTGAFHDIDDLSSGEKEVLYGYLRMARAAPERSILLIDEPELHLNPRLIRGLPAFYHRYLGLARKNQLWLVTHSDTLIRDALGRKDFGVFHMQPARKDFLENQASRVELKQDLDRAIVDLVGDLAAYRPGGNIVIFEGEDGSEFDRRMTCTLFPELEEVANPISAGSKRRVRDLCEVLELAKESGSPVAKVFSITDRDDERGENGRGGSQLSWDVYHIENYLLEPYYLLAVLRDLSLVATGMQSEDDVEAALKSCAQGTIAEFVRHRISVVANRQLVGAINLRGDPHVDDRARVLIDAIARSKDRFNKVCDEVLNELRVREMESKFSREAEASLQTGEWKRDFRGRDILQAFSGKHCKGRVTYEALRDLIIARMRDAGFRPSGMATIIDKVIAESK